MSETRTLVTGRGGIGRPTRRQQRRRENLIGYTFLLPWLVGVIGLTAGPMLASLYLAFTDFNLFDSPTWIGIDNFTAMFSDARFRQSVTVTIVYVLIGTPVKLVAALGVAVLLNRSSRAQGAYRAGFYLPSLIGASVAVAIVWRSIFASDGPVDGGLSLFGIHLGGWVGNVALAMPMLVLLSVWQFGAPMVIFLAGLKQVPQELYEAAEMDGAGAATKFRAVTLPTISPVLFFNLLLETISSFQVFASAYIISNGQGGPGGSTLFYTLYLYIKGFGEFRMGYASAMAWVLMIVIGVITLIMFRTSNAWVHYAGDER